jgi:DNA polymerase family A
VEWAALDFETYFDDQYGLGKNKLTTEHYVRDARFDPIMVAVRLQGWNKTEWIPKPDIARELHSMKLDQKRVIIHHAHFDGLILEHHYDIHPAFYMCTLSMGRGLLGNGLKLGLDALAHHYGLEPKSVPYDKFKGLHYEQLSPDVLNELGDGACHDVDLSLDILRYMLAGYMSRTLRPMQAFPTEELALIDQTVRMFTRPRIIGDTQMFADLWQREQKATDEALIDLGLIQPGMQHDPVAREAAAKRLRSDDSFAALLEAEGVEPELKMTTSGNIKFAFAKTDPFMQDIIEGGESDPDTDEWSPGQDRIYLLAQARLKAKSTLEQTRSERLGWMSTRGAMCVYLNYCGALTTRDSGGDKVNWQNERRGSPLRKAKLAPRGKLVGTVDASQVEARFLDTIVDERDAVQAWRDKRDIYSEIATEFYNEPVNKTMKDKRGLGKLIKLSCGYGAGDKSIIMTARKGTYGPVLHLTDAEGTQAKELYRYRHPAVESSWEEGGILLKVMNRFEPYSFFKPFEILVDRANGFRRIVLPNGMHIIYDSLEWHCNEEGKKYWRVRTRRGYAKLYGAKVIQHCIQAISRVHTMQVAVRIERETGLWPWMRNHDELAYLVDDNQHAEPTMKWIAQQLSTPPRWLPSIPLDAEWTLGERYEK